MRILQLRTAIRNLKRYREILRILIKYGFDDLLDRIKVGSFVRFSSRFLLRRRTGHLRRKSRSERVRLAFEELGPAFIKFGQMLSTRVDLFPHETLDELRKLQDRVAPFSAERATVILETEYGRPLGDLFETFETEPVAAASIAQVHYAKAKDGRVLVLKIQRPAIEAVIRRDTAILLDLARLLVRHVPESIPFDPVGIVEEFGRWIGQELDFFQEGRNTERFRRLFGRDRTVRVPAVHWDLTTARVLALEYLPGIPVGDVDAIDGAGLDRRRLARNGARIALKAVFEHGFFHGDPHPGNILVQGGNVLVLLDFGLVGRVDDTHAGLLGRMLSGALDRDANRVLRALAGLGALGEDADPARLAADLHEILDRYSDAPLAQLKLDQLIREMLTFCQRHGLRLPRDLALMGKALMEVEGIARRLDPSIDMLSMAGPFIRRAVLKRAAGGSALRTAARGLEDYSDFFGALPGSLNRILTKLGRGDLGVKFRHEGLDHFIHELDRASNRLSFSFITAALIVGSSLVLRIGRGPTLLGLPAFGLVGYVLAGVFGLWLIVAIMRSGRL
jgi:ubiquinone biosynthesis protein